MDKKWILLMVVGVVLLFTFFFWPKSECGYTKGYDNFEEARCSCFGFIHRTPEYGDFKLDSTLNFSCYGFKMGETKVTYQMYNESQLAQTQTIIENTNKTVQTNLTVPINKIPIEFTFRNEAKPDDVFVVASIDGKRFYEKELKAGPKEVGGGGEADSIIFEVPNAVFAFEVIEQNSGVKEIRQINPSNGQYIFIAFFKETNIGEKFVIQQTEKKGIIID